MATASDRAQELPAGRSEHAVLRVSCGVHALHDGFTDALYVLLPIWQAEFGLSYGAIGFLRALYTGAMAGMQVPASMVAGRIGGPRVLGIGTALAGIGLVVASFSAGVVLLAVGLVLSGLGSSTQHPIGADLVARTFSGPRSRGVLGIYNFAGDLGKMALPAATAFLLAFMAWRPTTLVLGALGVIAAGLVLVLLRPTTPGSAKSEPDRDASTTASRSDAAPASGFAVLLTLGVIDSATRMGFLTFLPFLLAAKGAGLPLVGTALTLVFAGGAAGKLVCGFLGQRLGLVRTVFVTEGATALGIIILLHVPLTVALILLPLIGLALNGTSSVLYGSVPEFVRPEDTRRAFGQFYTGTIGSGAIAPVLFGLIGDAVGLVTMAMIVAVFVLLTLPLAWRLRSSVRS